MVPVPGIYSHCVTHPGGSGLLSGFVLELILFTKIQEMRWKEKRDRSAKSGFGCHHYRSALRAPSALCLPPKSR